jgi:CubicO group peptidase (beta-lactamase class C family)
MQQIDAMMQQAVTDRVFPGAVLLVSRKGAAIYQRAFGMANLFSARPMTADTIFDLASLTKPLATTVAVMKLVQTGRLDLTQELGSVLPEFKESEKSLIRIHHLLSHTSGFPDYRPYFQRLQALAPAKRRRALRRQLVAEPLVYAAGEKTLYSDLGFMVLAWVIEQVCGRRLDQFVQQEIYRPLSIDELFFVDLASPTPPLRFAATENCPWRGVVLEGQVHDENAYVVGGIEGHAGLFGTAGAVQRLLAELVCVPRGGDASLFPKELVDDFLRPGAAGDRALGFDIPAAQNSSAGRYFSRNSVGHLGFTGTSFWVDLRRQLAVILLTNRVHPSRQNEAIKSFRPKIHDAVLEVFGGLSC